MRQLPAAWRLRSKAPRKDRHSHRIGAEVSTKAEIKEAIDAGATVLIFRDVGENEIPGPH